MPLFVIFIIWYVIFGQNNPKIYEKLKGKLPLILIGFVLLSGLSGIIEPLLILSLVLLFAFGPLALIIWLILRSPKGKKRQRKEDYEYYKEHYKQSEKSTGTTVTGLTRSVAKRRRIVERFNRKYDLNLTEQEITRIVDASYMSNCWEREIYDMDKSYDNVAQWYKADTAWLRAYLRVFPVQNVTSDFENQRRLCVDAFEQIFRTVCPEKFMSVEDCVEETNRRYLTNFDEITFAVAHRFLEENGRSYGFPHFDIRGVQSDIDELKEKYDKETGMGMSREKMRMR